MGFAKWKDIAEFIAILAIVGSLIFVGLELRQARQIAVADIYQQRTAMLIDVHSIRLTSELLYRVVEKDMAQEELSTLERRFLNGSHIPLFSYWENNHFQYQMGLMPEEQWNASRNAIRNYLQRSPGRLEWWATERPNVRKSFADAVDEILAEN